MQQHAEDMVVIIMCFIGNLFLLQQWKNFENTFRIDKVITMSLVYYFFGTQCSHETPKANQNPALNKCAVVDTRDWYIQGEAK